jgi:hypothetical protein
LMAKRERAGNEDRLWFGGSAPGVAGKGQGGAEVVDGDLGVRFGGFEEEFVRGKEGWHF